MIRKLTIRGLGPHKDTTVEVDDPKGTYTVTAPSQRGKTFLMHALCFALWAKDAFGSKLSIEHIHDDCDQAEVDLLLMTGTRVSRTMNRRRQYERIIRKRDADPELWKTESDFAEALGPIGNEERIRPIMVPLAWVPMVQDKRGRPLRDYLSDLLPKGDLKGVVKAMMKTSGQAIHDDDILDEKWAYDQRKKANTKASELKGRYDGGVDLIDRTEHQGIERPSADDVANAEAVRAHAAKWNKYDADLEEWEKLAEQAATAERRIEAWDKAMSELGERPDDNEEAIQAARKLADEAREKLNKATEVAQLANTNASSHSATVSRIKADLIDGNALSDTAVCPTCGRDGWDGAKEQWQAEEDRLNKLREETLPAARDAFSKASEAKDKAIKARDEATANLHDAEEALASARDAGFKARAWDQKKSELGARPEVPEVPDRPSQPLERRPSTDDVTDAVLTLQADTRADGAEEKRQSDLAAYRAQLEQDKKAWQEAEAEATRLDALVNALRRAPGVVAEEQVKALGDTGPVTLRFGTAKGEDAITVLIDGRPWELASQGRRVYADLCLRNAIRRVAGLPWVPLFVDNTQDWSGDWPDIDGPLFFLRTEDDGGDTITVEEAA